MDDEFLEQMKATNQISIDTIIFCATKLYHNPIKYKVFTEVKNIIDEQINLIIEEFTKNTDQ